MQLDFTINLWREDDQYVAHALPLDVMSSGPTPQAAREAVDEAVRCFVRTASDQGTLETILEECGYSRRNGGWAAPDLFQHCSSDWLGLDKR